MKTITQLIPILDKDTNEILYYTDENTGINYAPMNETTLHLIDGYELVDENGNVINVKKVTLTKKQPQYPKTYEDCCKELLLNPERASYSVSGLEYKRHLIVNFQRLIICRDAYWKIAGNWKPDYNNVCATKYIITVKENKIFTDVSFCFNFVLIFPTKEMCDAFYENFKNLIEECKELL